MTATSPESTTPAELHVPRTKYDLISLAAWAASFVSLGLFVVVFAAGWAVIIAGVIRSVRRLGRTDLGESSSDDYAPAGDDLGLFATKEPTERELWDRDRNDWVRTYIFWTIVFGLAVAAPEWAGVALIAGYFALVGLNVYLARYDREVQALC